jgi:GT2 family glycosyltransferase
MSLLDRPPAFLVGAQRSGTTWLQRLLAAHPAVVSGQESHLFSGYLGPLWERWQFEEKLRAGGGRTIGLGCYLTREQFLAQLRRIAETGLRSLEGLKPSASLLLEKTPDHSLHLSLIRLLFPGAPIIHLVRDGRDVVASLLAAGRQKWGRVWAPPCAGEAADRWVKWVQAVRREATPPLLEVRFEDLLADGPTVLGRVFEFLGVPPAAAEAEEICRRYAFDECAGGLIQDSLVLGGECRGRAGDEPPEFFRRGRAGSWRDELSAVELGQVEAVAGETLRELGYPVAACGFAQGPPSAKPQAARTQAAPPSWWREFERAERLRLELKRIKESRLYRLCCWLRGLWPAGGQTAPETAPPPGPHRGEPVTLAAPATGCVSVIIPFKDRVDLLHNCLTSLRRTTYRRRETVLVDNGSVEPRTERYLRRIARRRRTRIVLSPGVFNFSRLCNEGARAARGDWLLFLNNDTEVIAADWLDHLLHAAGRPGMGIVGATLLYPSGALQHAGMFPLPDGRWDHAWRGFPADHPGEAGELLQVRSVPAVTGACLLIGRRLFEDLGGFDEGLPVTHNDTDLCRRVRERGLLVVVTPHARLFHLESASRADPQGATVKASD